MGPEIKDGEKSAHAVYGGPTKYEVLAVARNEEDAQAALHIGLSEASKGAPYKFLISPEVSNKAMGFTEAGAEEITLNVYKAYARIELGESNAA